MDSQPQPPLVICTICARGGSKGVPGKNIRPIAGLPLIAHSIRAARACAFVDAIAVSSDAADIRATAQAHGADILIKRPADLASDTAGKLPAIRHAALQAETILGRPCSHIIDLDATSPLRLPDDIAGAHALSVRTGGNVITGCPARRSPYFNLVTLDANGVPRPAIVPEYPILRRQDAPACYDLNASIYVWPRALLIDGPDTVYLPNTQFYAMPEERSIDIDSALDFAIVELLLTQQSARD